MPNTVVTKSFKNSGMKKAGGSYDDGGVPAQGLPVNYNTTYPSNEVDSAIAEDAPVNMEYRARIPDTMEPLGSVDLGPVSSGGK